MINSLIRYIENHGNQAKIINGKLLVLDIQTKDNKIYSEWIIIEPKIKKVREWLGY